MEKLSEKEIAQGLKQLEGWEYADNGIECSFEFKNFKEAFSLMTRVAFECEAQNHHPDWSNVYNRLYVRLSTHDAGGVTEKDFNLAQSIERILAGG
ncbi:MAG TPA: 4a-hydroxytetrahydrobiopterin dehydratase [Eudoraea sp.]|nr:4a-hydroxytetrahydrobiopterin dehydratase [Eudoraea sp.]